MESRTRQTLSSLVLGLSIVAIPGVSLAQTAGQDPAPVRVGGVIRVPTKTYNVDPVYPSIATAARAEGVVIVEILIGAAGTVQDAKVLRSVPPFDAAAIDAVMQWRYTPTFVNGVPTPVYVTVTVSFALDTAARGTLASAPTRPAAADPAPASPAPAPAVASQAADPASPAKQPVRVGGEVKTPVKITHVDPVYPDIAMAARKEGTVILELLAGTDGRVQNAKVLRSVPLLDQAALDCVRQWVYRPTMLNGEAVPVYVTVTVAFALPR